jgi:hypothetical protein
MMKLGETWGARQATIAVGFVATLIALTVAFMALLTAIWASPSNSDTSDRCQYGTGGVEWRSEFMHLSLSGRQCV